MLRLDTRWASTDLSPRAAGRRLAVAGASWRSSGTGTVVQGLRRRAAVSRQPARAGCLRSALGQPARGLCRDLLRRKPRNPERSSEVSQAGRKRSTFEPSKPESAGGAVPARAMPRRCGTVATTVMQVLTDVDGPMRARDIRLAVEQWLGSPVAKGTVESCRSLGWRGESPTFVRVGRGNYQLRSAAPFPAEVKFRDVV